ncbi:hypothetical protein D3C86_1516080 [compost metagenome]
MHRGAMDRGVAPGDAAGLGHAIGGDRSHGHHHVTFQASGRTAGTVGQVHRYVAAIGDMPHFNAGLLQGRFKGKTAADQKGHHVVVFGPGLRGVADFLHQLPVAPDAVQGQISSQIGAFSQQGAWASGIGDVKDRTRFRVALGIQQEVIGPVTRQGNQVRLGHARCDTGGGSDQTATVGGACLTASGDGPLTSAIKGIHRRPPAKGCKDMLACSSTRRSSRAISTAAGLSPCTQIESAWILVRLPSIASMVPSSTRRSIRWATSLGSCSTAPGSRRETRVPCGV